MRVEVVWAGVEQQWRCMVEIGEGATIAGALVEAQRLWSRRDAAPDAQLDWATSIVGVHGQVRPREFPLRDGDRIEIYRELRVDPKEGRRQRARRLRSEAAARRR